MKRKLETKIEDNQVNHSSTPVEETRNGTTAVKKSKNLNNAMKNPSTPTLGDEKEKVKAKRKPGRRWSMEEDRVLRELVKANGSKHWKKIAEEFAKVSGTGRTDVQCLHRWNKCLKPGLVKGPWTKEEDQVIHDMIMVHGVKNIRWSTIAKKLPGRLGKQVRERWINHLDPTISKLDWTSHEDKKLYLLQKEVGNKWKLIAQMMPGRSENGVKNRWHSIKPTLQERIRMWEVNNICTPSEEIDVAHFMQKKPESAAKSEPNGCSPSANLSFLAPSLQQTQHTSNGVHFQQVYNGLQKHQMVNLQMTHPMPANLASKQSPVYQPNLGNNFAVSGHNANHVRFAGSANQTSHVLTGPVMNQQQAWNLMKGNATMPF